MSFKTRDGKTHQSTVMMGENGLPVDSIATISGSYIFIEGTQPLTYSSGGATITLPVGSDLTPVTTAKARYTGKYVLITKDNRVYYIDRQSINVVSRTFTISVNDKVVASPIAINMEAGWVVAEADIVNRLATTSAAKVDSIEFRDMQFQFQLDGDPVTVRGLNSGHTIEPNSDGSTNVEVEGFDPSGAKQKLRTSETGRVNPDGVYDSTLNTQPASVGLVTSIRNQDDALDNQVGKPTSVRGSLNLDTTSQDVSIHNHAGNKLNYIDTANSTSAPLAANASYTGTWINCEEYSNATILVLSDQNSVIDGFKIQYSVDGINVDHSDVYTISASSGIGGGNRQFVVSLPSMYYRIMYTNGTTPQGSFRLQSKLHTFNPHTTSYRVDEKLYGQENAKLVKSSNMGLREDGIHDTVALSNNNSVKVAITERQSEVRGRVSVTIPIIDLALTGGSDVLYTVTPGKVLFISSFLTSALNTSTNGGSFILRDGIINKVGFLIPSRVSGSSPSAFSSASPSLPEPLRFETDVNLLRITGTIRAAGYLIGYEEEL